MISAIINFLFDDCGAFTPNGMGGLKVCRRWKAHKLLRWTWHDDHRRSAWPQ